jgi:uncharacterized protein (DUF433 family)
MTITAAAIRVGGGERQTVSSGLRGTSMTIERIEINPAVMLGKPVIRGTRITVELILRKLAEGETESELLEDYPHLTAEDTRAAIAYGAASEQVEGQAEALREINDDAAPKS